MSLWHAYLAFPSKLLIYVKSVLEAFGFDLSLFIAVSYADTN